MAQTFDRSREVVRGELGVAFVGVPDAVDRLGEVLPELSASGGCFRSVIRQREIQLQYLGGEGLDRDILPRIHPIGGPDQKAEDQRGQEGEKPANRADHVTGTTRCVFLGKVALQDEPDGAANKNDYGDR